MGVRVLSGTDIPNEALRATDHHKRWVEPKVFRDGVANDLELRSRSSSICVGGTVAKPTPYGAAPSVAGRLGSA